MKGIILAGGSGKRLYPMTQLLSKQLLPIYDKPMIYYPLSFLMLGKITDILIICTPSDLELFQQILGNGEELGISIQFKLQSSPRGLADAFIIAEDFIGTDDVTLILGDNLFYGDIQFYRDALSAQVEKKLQKTAHIFAYFVNNPVDFGVVEFEKQTLKVKSIEEKPSRPKSNYAIPGLYIFDSTVAERAKKLTPSKRGELEITDLIMSYFLEDKLGVEIITRGVAWLDTGTPKNLLDAASFVGAIESRQGQKVACLEEVALRMKFIDLVQFKKITSIKPNGPYKQYLLDLIEMLEA